MLECHPLRLAPQPRAPLTFLFPRNLAVVLAPHKEDCDERAGVAFRLETHASTGTEPVLRSALGHADYVLTHHRLHGRRTRLWAHPPAPASACQGSYMPRDRPARRWTAREATTVGESAPASTPRLVVANRATSRPSQVGWLKARRSSGRTLLVSEWSCFASRRSAHGSIAYLSGLIQPRAA